MRAKIKYYIKSNEKIIAESQKIKSPKFSKIKFTQININKTQTGR